MSGQILKLREQISAKKQAIAALENAGLPAASAMALWQGNVERAVSGYSEVVRRLAATTITARHDSDVDFAGATGLVFGNSDRFIVGAIFRHLEQEITADLRTEIARIQGDYPPGVDDKKRVADHKRLVRELLALERTEEAEIEAELLRGNQIERRADANPAAVLAVPDDALAAAGLL